MIIRTTRSRLAAFVDVIVTAIAWIAFIYFLGTGLWEIVIGQRQGGPDISRIARFFPTMETLGIYALVALVNGAILLAWARYNAYRFRGVDRRQAPVPLTDAQLAESFGLALAERMGSASAKSMTIHHGREGDIERVDIHMGMNA
jgi:biofilm PGA synthesis protein PgaD